MRSENFSADCIVRLLERQRVATMQELKDALGTRVDMTVFRKLRTIAYLSSYSHAGRYYTLRSAAQFDSRGLWTLRGVHFSMFGSLVETAETFVNRSVRGYLVCELSAELQVEAKDPLLKLVRLGRLFRKDVAGLYLYCSSERVKRQHQLISRERPSEQGRAFAASMESVAESNEAKAATFCLRASLMRGKDGSLAGSNRCGLGAAEIARSLMQSAWILTLSPKAEGSFSSMTCRWAGCANRVAGVHRRKKNARTR